MIHNWFEPLEPKRLFSAALKNGILTINGTDNADTISVWIASKNPARLIANDGVKEFSFTKQNVHLIRVHALGGDDHVAALNVGGEVKINLSIDGGNGNDQLTGGGGDDTLIGGLGDDDLRGGAGSDWADYRYINQTFTAGNGKDYGLIATMDGKTDDHTFDGTDNIQTDIENILATQFRDSIVCSGDSNTIVAGDGPDNIDGSTGNDSLIGGAGANNLFGGPGKDTLVGGSGASTLDGGAGNDSLRGGSGDELLIGGTGGDVYNGGPGFDAADFTGDTRTFHLTFDHRSNDGPGTEDDNFIEIDQILASSDNDRVDASGLSHGLTFRTTGHGADIVGTEFADTLTMEDGTIEGLGGNDLLEGGINGSSAQSVIDGGAGNDSIRTADGADLLTGGGGNDSISAGDGNDTVNGGAGRDTVRAAAGDDNIRGDGGTDHLFGDDGNDTVLGNGKTDILFGGNGSDSFLVTENDDGFVKDFDPTTDQLITDH